MRHTRNTRGQGSLDALILLVAIILVVAVTAIVLMTSGSSIQQATLLRSTEGRKQVTAGLEVLSIIGEDASIAGGSPHNIEHLFVMVRLLPGTGHHPLNNTLLVFDDRVRPATFTYNNTCSSQCEASNTVSYNVYYLKESEDFEAGHMHSGDVAKIAITPPTPLQEERVYSFTILPMYGPRTEIEFNTPQSMLKQKQTLWPVG